MGMFKCTGGCLFNIIIIREGPLLLEWAKEGFKFHSFLTLKLDKKKDMGIIGRFSTSNEKASLFPLSSMKGSWDPFILASPIAFWLSFLFQSSTLCSSFYFSLTIIMPHVASTSTSSTPTLFSLFPFCNFFIKHLPKQVLSHFLILITLFIFMSNNQYKFKFTYFPTSFKFLFVLDQPLYVVVKKVLLSFLFLTTATFIRFLG